VVATIEIQKEFFVKNQTFRMGKCSFQVMTRGKEFVGIGKIRIGSKLIRSGRLPMKVYSQAFNGYQLSRQELLGVDMTDVEIRIHLELAFTPMPVKMMRDHSFDPIHHLGDWESEHSTNYGRLDLVIRPAHDRFEGVDFTGFSYSWEYASDTQPLFYLYDMASWELDGDAEGSTVYSQSSCSDPVAVLSAQKSWSTEGVMHWADPASVANTVMTHNLPRWASHQWFDYQFKGDATLIGVFERVDLIRSVICHDAGKPELKHFDKHIFDETKNYKTSPKKILLNTDVKSLTDQKNLWTWVFDETHARARGEFGFELEPMIPRLSQNYWHKFTYESYHDDLIPAARALGLRQLFIDNVNKSSATERCPGPIGPDGDAVWTWNMCCSHEFEPAPRLGGVDGLKKLVDDCAKDNLVPFSWTNNEQSLASPVNMEERDGRSWFIRMEDTRLKYGGAYTNCMSFMDFANDDCRNYWVNCLKKIRDTTGLKGYLFDSFYNMGWMPVNYNGGKPYTQWRQLIAAMKELQAYDVHFLIESFGPFGQPQHGCPASYNLENIHMVYRVQMGTGYTTIPGSQELKDQTPRTAEVLYQTLANMACPQIPLHTTDENGQQKRIDEVWGEAHKQAFTDYNENEPFMRKRFLQEDGLSVIWHDQARTRATIFNFATREVTLKGTVRDVTVGEDLKPGKVTLQANHTYVVTGGEKLPTEIF